MTNCDLTPIFARVMKARGCCQNALAMTKASGYVSVCGCMGTDDKSETGEPVAMQSGSPSVTCTGRSVTEIAAASSSGGIEPRAIYGTVLVIHHDVRFHTG